MRKTITIPDAMEEWVKTQIKTGRYSNDSEYFRDLIRHDQDKKSAEHQLRLLIDEGLQSGISKNNVVDIMKNVESKLQENGKLSTNN